jgi:predicted dehydrogenase
MEILIIGLGSIANKHLHAIRTLLPDAKLFALRSGKKQLDLDGIKNIYALEDLINKPAFAIISNPTNLHAEYIHALAIRDIPMMIEKPALHAFGNANELLEIVQSKKSFTYVACNLRFHPGIQFFRNYLNQGRSKVNEVNVYCGSYLPDWRPTVDFKTVYSANVHMGGGVHLDLIHELDYTIWLFGQPVKFSGFQSNTSTLQIDAPDYAHYLLNYPDFNASISLNYYRRDPKRVIEVVLEDETLTVDLIKNKVFNSKDELLYADSDFTILDTYIAQLKYFLEKLLNKEVPMNTFEDSLAVLKIALTNE